MQEPQHHPPRLLRKLLEWFCDPDLHPYLEGDLAEHFEAEIARSSLRKARWHYIRDVLLLFRPGIIRSFRPGQKLNPYTMFKHNLLISFRSIKKDKVSFLVNMAGLITGLTTVLLIYLWVDDELKMNRFHDNDDRLYQVFLNEPSPSGIHTSPNTPIQLAEVLKEEFPGVAQAANVIPYEWFGGEQFILSDGKERLFASRNQFASKDYFQLFSFQFLAGNKAEALSHPESVVISKELALKLFDTEDVVGKTLQWLHSDYGGTYQVTGVFVNDQRHSTQQFDAVFPFEVILADEGEEWLNWSESDPYTYLSLQHSTQAQELNQKLSTLIKSKNEALRSTLFAQKYSSTYLYDQYANGEVSGGRIRYVILFSLIGLLILVVACLNFTIMTTALATVRMKEIGVKKTMGALRKHLISQYLTESFFVTAIAFIITIGFVNLLLPRFSELSGKSLSFHPGPLQWLTMIVFVVFTAMLSGGYPALYLSGFSPLAALRGRLKGSFRGEITRKGLVVFQFVVSTVLVVTAIIVARQIDMIQSKNLGFDKENRVWFTMGAPTSTQPLTSEVAELTDEHIERFVQELKNIPGVVNATNFAHNVLGDYGTTTGLSWQGKEAPMLIAQISGGYDFIETMGMEMKEGRAYSREFATDRQKIILNETAIRQMGLDQPIGKTVNLWGEDREIIGVVKDFHIDQLYHDIIPVFVKLDLGDFAPHIMLNLAPGDQTATMTRIEEAFSNTFLKGFPFEYQYLDENYQRFYEQELRIGDFARYATGIAIFISSLGLFAFSGFTLKRRLKELAIRKVLGSSGSGLLVLILSSFLKLIGIATLVGMPIAFVIAQHWLQGFAFHIDLSIWHFVLASAFMLALMLMAIGFHTAGALRVKVINHLNKEV